MKLDDYDKMCSLENLRRAYRWVQSNPDASYKSYFRDAYAAYAASSDNNLRRLRKHLVRHACHPGHASKVYLPKPSGILRPYTLLTVTDQIVYQACVNIVAERLKPKVAKRYFKSTFGHLYAGKSSQFFYLKWQRGYRAFSRSIAASIDMGFNYVANFDLTAFYDSIDHNVLRHFLRELSVDADLIEFLLTCLQTWTSSTWTTLSNVIYHGHGIPQGPLASGLLGEVVLKHIDEKGCRRGRTRYFRYVDDVKLFGKSDAVLRHRLVALDLASKEIGLFPQSSKVNIRRVSEATDEIKSISRPPEPSLTPTVDKSKVTSRLRELTRRGEVRLENFTRFKYLLGQADPHHSLNQRLMKVLRSQPAFSAPVASYVSRYEKCPRKLAEAVLEYLRGDEIYHSVHGDLLVATLRNVPESHVQEYIEFCYRRLLRPGRSQIPPQPTYRAALLAWVLEHHKLKYGDLEKVLSEELDWWVKKEAVKHLSADHYGPESYVALLNRLARETHAEPARIAALKMVDEGVDVRNPYKNVNESARLLLHAAGKVRNIGAPESMVGSVLRYVLDKHLADFNWKKLLGARHSTAEHIAFTVKRNYESDINGCVVTLDSLADLIWEAVYVHELPGKGYGQYGAMLKHPVLMRKFPVAASGLDALHQLRLQSVTAHPRHTKSGIGTRRLKHQDYYRIRPKVQSAIEEITLKVLV